MHRYPAIGTGEAELRADVVLYFVDLWLGMIVFPCVRDHQQKIVFHIVQCRIFVVLDFSSDHFQIDRLGDDQIVIWINLVRRMGQSAIVWSLRESSGGGLLFVKVEIGRFPTLIGLRFEHCRLRWRILRSSANRWSTVYLDWVSNGSI